jgi:Protein of unknown function (DUF3047)
MLRRTLRAFFATGVVLAVQPAAADTTPFSKRMPGTPVSPAYRLITLPGIAHNVFSFVDEAGATVLKIDSNNSAGTVALPFSATREGGATLAWRWKVGRMLERADMDRKTGDDYAARVYVFFDVPLDTLSFADRSRIRLARMVAGTDVPTAAICYVWDNKHRIGHSAWSPYSSRVRKIVLQTGPEFVGQWKSESRDLAADFKAAFGFDMPAVTGVAVGSDTDNTDDHVTTWFGDVAIVK